VSVPANNGQQRQTKQQCIDNFLKTGYGAAGNFMAKTGVPSFSVISIFTKTKDWLKGEGLSILTKGATRTAVDVGFTGAEAINCAIQQ